MILGATRQVKLKRATPIHFNSQLLHSLPSQENNEKQ